MTFEARRKALKEFAEKDDVRVLLASLRCGGCKYF
jgi:SNF2 family DNA or RNA helicase